MSHLKALHNFTHAQILIRNSRIFIKQVTKLNGVHIFSSFTWNFFISFSCYCILCWTLIFFSFYFSSFVHSRSISNICRTFDNWGTSTLLLLPFCSKLFPFKNVFFSSRNQGFYDHSSFIILIILINLFLQLKLKHKFHNTDFFRCCQL